MDLHLTQDLQKAWHEATDALGLARGTRLDSTSATALLRRCLAIGPATGESTAPLPPPERLVRLRGQLPQLASCLVEGAAAQVAQALEDPTYCRRLVELAADLRMSERMAPEICLAIRAGSMEMLSEAPLDAVIFADPQLIGHELYPLCIDACVAAGPKHVPVGVHLDWLVGDSATRVIHYDLEEDRFIEMSLVTPRRLDRALPLALGADEQHHHRTLDELFAERCRNRFHAAETLDHKAISAATWSKLGLSIPSQTVCSVGDVDGARQVLSAGGEWVLKPEASTGGQGVVLVEDPMELHQTPDDLVESLQICWAYGDAVIEERRDGLAYRDDHEKDHSLVIRLHVTSTPGGLHVESGCAIIGGDDLTPASFHHGGRSIELRQALGQLASRRGERICVDVAQIITGLQQTATAAVTAVADLDLVGVDLVLDLVGNTVVPVLIEANARPAGLIHSRRLSDGLAGVSNSLWTTPVVKQETVS